MAKPNAANDVRDYGLRSRIHDASIPKSPPADGIISSPPQPTPPTLQLEASTQQISTEEALEQQQDEQSETTENDEWETSKATVDERLIQAKVFLSSKNVHLQSDFKKHSTAIDNFLHKLAHDKVVYDLDLYDEVQDMLGIHQACIDEWKNQIIQRRKKLLAAPVSQRLTLEVPEDRAAMTGAPPENVPPFPIKRLADHDEFIETLVSLTTEGTNLRQSEKQGLDEVLQNPSIAREFLRERESQSQSTRLAIRARNQGRQRALFVLALQGFATNHEQHFEGGWQHTVLKYLLSR